MGLGEEEIKSTKYGKIEGDICCWIGLRENFFILFNQQSPMSKVEPGQCLK